ncbi:DUF72 domain-containing protein [Frigoriglobus tundricola]|uniref:DUF72 domain-containing protein n=1 Tax=Frigoriglobus tundricola TaxID=2774151 RepID=A0A6M5YI34_9BACT|nr:DUF72 domain-containing protein [Frigoriglobus tundricola]QJW93739.1 hypothetical protein FTUN_1250 [Frigoriglobus tundricola]
MNVFVGTSGYSYPKWKGSFYPAKLPTKQMLGYYGTHFRAVEINNTFYRPPTAAVLDGWAEQVPTGFRFVLKAPQEITHVKRLVNADEMVSSLFATADTLEERLGPVLFQLPPNFKKDVPRLRAFLGLLPKDRGAAFEFRNASWFDDEVFALLRLHRVAMCIADADDGLEVPFVSTADRGYLRLRRAAYDDSALRTWAARIRAERWRDVFVFFKHEDAGTGPRFAKRLLELLAEGEAVQQKHAG